MTTVLTLIDGLRPDALLATDAPHINGMRQRGAWTLQAQSVQPSITLVRHMSIFHAVPPTRHGIMQNLYQPLARPLPGLFEQVQQAGLRSGFFYNWEPLRDIGRPGSLHYSHFHANSHDFIHGDRKLMQRAVRYVNVEKPDFLFLYLGSLDEVGHAYGWMSSEYLAQVSLVDGVVGEMLAGLPPHSTVLLQSDHGGHDRTHGTNMPEDMDIPWIITGPGIRQNHEISQPVSLLNSAPTLTAVLHIPPAPQWDGRCVEEIFIS